MIDVMFFLLVFFLLFSTLKTAQTGVAVDLPKTLFIGNAEQNTMVISIDREARLFLGKQPVTLEQLTAKLAQEVRNDPQTRVVVRPDSVVPYERIVRVMDALAGAGVAKPLLGVDRRQMPKPEN